MVYAMARVSRRNPAMGLPERGRRLRFDRRPDPVNAPLTRRPFFGSEVYMKNTYLQLPGPGAIRVARAASFRIAGVKQPEPFVPVFASPWRVPRAEPLAAGGTLRPPGMISILCICFAVLSAAFSGAALAAGEHPFPALYQDKSIFLRAMEKAEGATPFAGRATGLTLPHHLLAADLMAQGLAGLRGRDYDRIILLSPDHFKRGKTRFAVPARDFRTCLGLVRLDRGGAAALLENPLVSTSNLFSHEHGVRSLLPFIAAMLPDTPVLPVALSISSSREECDALADSLLPLVTDKTLILQSTDFSHYLPWEEAKIKDAETLRVIASGRAELVFSLHQPSHLDSRAAQYLQMKLQGERFGSSATVTANHNACEYLPAGEAEPAKTTSYILQVYSPDTLPLPAALSGYVLGGDFFTGRYLRKYLDTPEKRERAAAMILEHTGGRPLILNLEGVLMPSCPPGPESGRAGAADEGSAGGELPSAARPLLCMPEADALELLRRINCVAVSLANNHSGDFGAQSRADTRQALLRQGIAVLEQGEVHGFPEFFLAAFTDVDNNSRPMTHLLRRESFAHLADGKSDSRPLFVFVHCGREFRPAPGTRERFLAGTLESLGAELFIGAHPHRAGSVEARRSGIRVWSLGNLLFDQVRQRADGAVLEVVFFPQGTWWARQRPVGNLYKRLPRGGNLH